jgi:hypothetical protein|tara:strand:- start:3960 stop:4529 length:570 start_codon:yes stop_codon:yes gene_type:complete
MGVDIYGKEPKLTSKKPEMDWDNDALTEADKKAYWEVLEDWEDKNPGYYFRSNWWGWRPIVMLCDVAAHNHKLDIKTESWMGNDGMGPDTWEECTALADALQDLIDKDGSFEEEEDVIYCNMGSWSTMNGGIVSEDIIEELNEVLPYGKVTMTGIVRDDGVYYPSHSSPKWLIDQFIVFLRHCGGFSVW